MVLIITGTIVPMVKETQIIVKNSEERLKQYKDCIRFFIGSGAFQKIIFGENTKYPGDDFQMLIDEASQHRIQFEYLSFQGNTEEIELHGKGFGEGEIMKYIFDHSSLLDGEKAFMKVTGRMQIDNIADLVSKCKEEKTYFNIPKTDIRRWYDTRVYAMPVSQFKASFAEAYHSVDDTNGKYLEVVYTDVLKREQIKVTNFPRFPRIIGISGSTGANYVYKEWKCKVKDILSLCQYYHVK